MSFAPVPRPLGYRVVATFVSPRTLFEEIREAAPWIGPLVISIAIGILVLVLLPNEIFVAQAEETARLSRSEVTLTSDPATVAFYERIRIAMGMLMVRPILAFVMAGFLALVFSGLLRGRGEFRQYLSVTTHALLITALGTLAALPLQILRADAYAQLSLAVFAPFLDAGAVTYRLLQVIDPFTIWMIMVVALGVSEVNGRRSPARAAAILVGGYLGFALATVLLTP